MKVKFKKLSDDAILPSYAKPGDAGLDITATSDGVVIHNKENDPSWYYIEYKTGLAVELPDNHVGLMLPRSSISKSALFLANSVAVVDSKFRGECCFRFKIDAGAVDQATKDRVQAEVYKKGDRIGQMLILPYPTIEPEWAEELSETERGQGGFGSTGT